MQQCLDAAQPDTIGGRVSWSDVWWVFGHGEDPQNMGNHMGGHRVRFDWGDKSGLLVAILHS